MHLARRVRALVRGAALAASLLGAAAVAADSARAEEAAARPNVLFIAIDDLNDWVGCLRGHPQAQTPHLDRLAARGTLLANAHCQAPLCNPSRTSLLTGLRPSTTGVYALEPWFRVEPKLRDHVTLVQHFRAQGYRTLTGGKIWHGGYPPRPERADEFHEYGPPSGVGARPPQKLVTTPDGNHPLVDWGAFPHRDEDKGDYQLASWAVERLEAKLPEPFFLACGFFLPHVPCYATQKWFDLYPEASLELPPVKLDDRADVPEFAWFLHWKLPEPRLSWLKQADQWGSLVRAYLASTSFMDSQLGRVLDALERQGLAERTIVVVWSDHGWHLGEKGITGKNSLWERSTRVPLVFAGPGISPGAVCREPAELLDLYPTLAELCGLPPPARCDGHSLVPQLKDAAAPRAWPAITTHNPDNHAVRSRRWRYIRYADGSEELYDLQADPHEWTNLAGDPTQAAVLAEHRRFLPAESAPPLPGSKSRLLVREGDAWLWEHAPIRPEDKVE